VARSLDKTRNSKWGLAAGVAICLAAGGLGTIATSAKIPTWYAGLAKPAWNPPNWVFGPVWTTLYVLMAVAAWLVWSRRRERNVTLALTLFGVQLGLNTVWSFVFFGMEAPGAAMIELVVLWVAIVGTVGVFRRVSGVAAGLMVPYLAWVSFAGCLNYAIWQLNR